jgi:hypothetical protein
MGEGSNTYRILVRKSKGKKPPRRTIFRWKDSIRMDVLEIGSEGVDRIHLAQDRNQWQVVVNMVINLWVP